MESILSATNILSNQFKISLYLELIYSYSKLTYADQLNLPMQFVSHGPDIPDELLQVHEEGRAVFFCGAGISYPAGLPDFSGLVDEIYKRLGTTPTDFEERAYEHNQYDITLNLLEHRYPGGRFAVRGAIAELLQPKMRRLHASIIHTALLHLARDRNGSLRLVTTNFDRIFELVRKRIKQSHEFYAAPTLPIPKASRWNGLVYLHGLLPLQPDESALNRLVVTSGDFGLAYLTERWAARFVSDLFRNYVVCFVGYSINDPVLRYIMDALAADRILGESTPQTYALGGCELGQEMTESIEWKAKGVTPILYTLNQGRNAHSALHQTLKVWAETYRDGVYGKQQIVTKNASARPSESTLQDNFVGRMLWALSDKSGLPAKRFSELNPAPPLEWLTAFSKNHFRFSDLSRFGITPHPSDTDDLQFSLINRPAPYNRTPRMALIGSQLGTEWDRLMGHIAYWLTRHLNDPQLIYWLLENGIEPHDRLSELIKFRLEHFARLEREGETSDLNDIRINSPNAIPDKNMRLLWHLLLSGRVKSNWNEVTLFNWKIQFAHNGMSSLLRMELRELLTPVIELGKPDLWLEDDAATESPEHLGQLVSANLALRANHVHAEIGNWTNEYWRDALPELLDDLQQLLNDALDLLQELGKADNLRDYSYLYLPSISPHWQNRGFNDWIILIELLRDAWLAVRSDNPKKVTRIAEHWFKRPYPTFKRLAFFAASHENCIISDGWVDWLLCDDGWWLWSIDTQREVLRLLALQGRGLSSSQSRLETAILAGPPKRMFNPNIEDEDWQKIVDHSVWLRLVKLDASGLNLGIAARNRLNAISTTNPSLKLEPYEREEFPSWMSGTGDPDYEDNLEIDIAPRKRHELVPWLKNTEYPLNPFKEDNWRETCRTRFFHCLFALCDLANENEWSVVRWREALQEWSKEDQIQRSWHFAAPLVETMPDGILLKIAHGVAWWLRNASNYDEKHEDILLNLCLRLLDLHIDLESGEIQEDEPDQNPITAAINHPVGLVTEALLNLLFKQNRHDDERLPEKIEGQFTILCDTKIALYRYGRVVLASRLIALFRIDQPWTEKNLLPLFRWSNNTVEAQNAWRGFLWSPRIFRPSLDSLLPDFLETASHYNELGIHGQQYAGILTYTALEYINEDESIEFKQAFEALPKMGLQEAAKTLARALESSGEQRENYWTNRIRPFWHTVWPQSIDRITSSISESLALTCIAAGGKFSEALDLFFHWLQPIQRQHYVTHQLQESHLCEKEPVEALRLLNRIIDVSLWPPQELLQCLKSISQAMPEMNNDGDYQRLVNYANRNDQH